MTIQIEAHEVDQFEMAIAGLQLDLVRTDKGIGPCRMTCAGSEDAMVSAGSMGFSAFTRTTIPDDCAVFLLVTAAPPGSAYCGVDLDLGQLHFYAPGTSFVGINPAGLGASILVVPTASIKSAAALLEIGDPNIAWSTDPLQGGPAVEGLRAMLTRLTATPEMLEDPREAERAKEWAAGALIADVAPQRGPAPARIDSRKIVRDAIDFVESTMTLQPTMSELCRAACASESRVRQAFVEVLDAPPTEYFRYRLLNRLRDDLLLADPITDSVTHIASSLGVTQLGRVAGRYRAVFGELPRDTLHLTP